MEDFNTETAHRTIVIVCKNQSIKDKIEANLSGSSFDEFIFDDSILFDYLNAKQKLKKIKDIANQKQ